MTIPMHEATTKDITEELARRCEYVVVIVGGSPDCDREGLEARMSIRCADGAGQCVCDVVMAAMRDYARDKGCRLLLDEDNGYKGSSDRSDA